MPSCALRQEGFFLPNFRRSVGRHEAFFVAGIDKGEKARDMGVMPKFGVVVPVGLGNQEVFLACSPLPFPFISLRTI
jgi:hypothetical protein